MTLVLILVCLAGAAAAGLLIYGMRETFKDQPVAIAAIGGHGFMLAYMGFAAFLMHMHGGMLASAALSALPMIALGALKLFRR